MLVGSGGSAPFPLRLFFAICSYCICEHLLVFDISAAFRTIKDVRGFMLGKSFPTIYLREALEFDVGIFVGWHAS